MALRGIAFDKDGTLIDIHASWVSAGFSVLRLMCARAQSEHRFDELLALAGFDSNEGRLHADSEWAAGTTEALLALWASALELPPSVGEEMLVAMNRQAMENVHPVTDLAVLLPQLRAMRLELAVTTMDTESAAKHCMTHLGVVDHLSFICGCDSGHGHKPGPGMVQAFCRARALKPREVVVVGDTPHDMHMGRAAHAALVVGVTSGVADAATLRPLADAVIADIAQLPELLASHPLSHE